MGPLRTASVSVPRYQCGMPYARLHTRQFFQDHVGSFCQIFFCNTLDTDMILIFYHSLVVKKSWHRLQGTKHIWRLPCGIVIPMSLQWTLVFIPSRGCLGLLGFFSRVCEPFGFPPEYRTRQDNPDVNTPKEVWSLCVHRLFLCKIKASRSLYFILDQQQRRNSTAPDSRELGQTKLFPFVWWL